MAIKRKKRMPDGSFGPVESVTGLPDVNHEAVMAFEAIATQNELIASLQEELTSLKTEIETLKGAGS
jgi:hypothetical protein